jgi:hypothetical protein
MTVIAERISASHLLTIPHLFLHPALRRSSVFAGAIPVMRRPAHAESPGQVWRPRGKGDHKGRPYRIADVGATLVVALLPPDEITRFKPTEIRSKTGGVTCAHGDQAIQPPGAVFFATAPRWRERLP